jgi:hypothetical protein
MRTLAPLRDRIEEYALALSSTTFAFCYWVYYTYLNEKFTNYFFLAFYRLMFGRRACGGADIVFPV